MRMGRLSLSAAGMAAAGMMTASLAIPAPLPLFGGASAQDPVTEVRRFLSELERKTPPPVEPLPVFKPVNRPDLPDVFGIRDPFVPPDAGEAEPEEGFSGPRPDPDRKREPLESFELDALRYVGIMTDDKRKWAVILTPTHILYPVSEGNYIGKNDGRIVHIGPDAIQIEALIPVARGRWEKKHLTLSASTTMTASASETPVTPVTGPAAVDTRTR